jgi:hypothetical protein
MAYAGTIAACRRVWHVVGDTVCGFGALETWLLS